MSPVTVDWLKEQALEILQSLLTYDWDPTSTAGGDDELPLADEGNCASGAPYVNYEWDWQDFPSGLIENAKRWKLGFSASYTGSGDETPEYGLVLVLQGKWKRRDLVVWLWQRDDAGTRDNAAGDITIYAPADEIQHAATIAMLKLETAKIVLPEMLPHSSQLAQLRDLGIDTTRPLEDIVKEVNP